MNARLRRTILFCVAVSPLGISSGQTKYLQRGQSLLGLSFAYSQSKSINSRGLEFAHSKDGAFAVGGFFALAKPEGARIVGVGFDGNLGNPGTKPGVGLSAHGSFARASIPDRSASSVVALGLEPFLRYPGETIDFISFGRLSGALGRGTGGERFVFGASFGVDVILKPTPAFGVTLGAAVTMAGGETGFAASVAVLFLGRREP